MAPPNLGKDVIARYGNWFRGDDDFFTHVLILKNGECWRLGQGLEVVEAHRFKAPTLRKIAKHGGAPVIAIERWARPRAFSNAGALASWPPGRITI